MSPPHPRDIKSIPALRRSEEAAARAGPDDGGIKEATLFGLGLTVEQMEKRAAAEEIRRSERFREHFERIAIFALYFFTVLFGIAALTWGFHLLAPTSWRYLTDDQMSRLQAVVTGGAIGVLLAHIRRRIG